MNGAAPVFATLQAQESRTKPPQESRLRFLHLWRARPQPGVVTQEVTSQLLGQLLASAQQAGTRATSVPKTLHPLGVEHQPPQSQSLTNGH